MSSQEELEVTAMEFYTQLFTRQEVLDPGPILSYVPTKVTADLNDFLLSPLTAEEVQEALFMIGANKAPGPDGLTAGSISSTRKNWDQVSQEQC